MHKREFRKYSDCIAKQEENSGVSYIEQKASMTINEMYTRMIKQGDIRSAQLRKSNNLNSPERASKMINEAIIAPQYMTENAKLKLTKTMSAIDTKLKTAKKAQAHQDEINKAVSKQMEKMQKAETAKITGETNV